MSTQYKPKNIEQKWQDLWRKNHVAEVEKQSDKKKYYLLEMFPYPSGTAHMGHVRNYTMGDVMSRYKMLQGYNVLHPMGWDAFGLPAENAAIKNKVHPAKWTYSNIAYMRRQFERMGWLFDWRREVATCASDYYKWEQLFFLKMLEQGIAYRKESAVNWCESCNTVLANEQVEDGKCWRCSNEVTTKELTQWFFKITDYVEELLDGLDELPGWPERVKTMQRNWIGKSNGAEIIFEVVDGEKKGTKIPVFTTRPDTVCGVSFLSLAPEHPLTLQLATVDQKATVEKFVERIRKQDKVNRTAENFEKEGVPLGAHVRNPITGEVVPVYAANFVLMDYGSGAVMAVPAHDIRDHAFAKKYNLPMKQVIQSEQAAKSVQDEAFVDPGVLIDSKEFTGLQSETAKVKIADWLQKKNLGKPTTSYKLRDWGISRQRYWGSPIPVIYCDSCGIVPVPESQLPVILPEDVEFTGQGASPLKTAQDFVNVSCPKCSKPAKRETDTMDTFMESSWYYIRFTSVPKPDQPWDNEEAKYWLPLDQYIGGIEHATMHLLYFRFYHRVLQDIGFLSKEIAREPVRNLLNQGIVYKDGAKMSKSKGNIVDPESLIEKYGCDTTRIFVLFAAPPEKVLEWSDQGVEGSFRFVGRVWRMMQMNSSLIEGIAPFKKAHSELTYAENKNLRSKTHQTIKKVTEDLEGFHFNTAISAIMELVNSIYAFKVEMNDADGRAVLRESIEAVVQLLNPFAPHVSEEIWNQLGYEDILATSSWPTFDAKAIELDLLTVVVQVNGKLRAQLQVPKDISKQDLEKRAKEEPKVVSYLEGKNLVKTIVVPGRLVNFVVK